MLDPGNISENVVGDIYVGDLPKLPEKVRQLGHVPDIEKLWPGDLILTQGAEGKAHANQIFQARSSNTGSEWIHAAIYVGNWKLIEARPRKNVQINTLFDFIPRSKILIRRLRLDEEIENNQKIVGFRVALNSALFLQDSKYGLFTLLKSTYHQVFDKETLKRREAAELRKNSIICSGLYAKSVRVAAGILVEPQAVIDSGDIITPAVLASSSKLKNVDVGWRRITNRL